MAEQSIPLTISIAPFPEGFQGDMDETFQQAVQLMGATVQGAFLTGLVLPPGSTLPTSDVGPIAMAGQWYFFNPTTNSYQPQSLVARAAKNYAKNSIYQVQQVGPQGAPVLAAGVNRTFDMAMCRMTTTGVLTTATDVGPLAGADYDTCQSAVKYVVGTTAPTLGTTDIYAHEHLIEGSDVAPIQNEVLSLSFLCWVNQPGTYSVYLANGARDASYCTTFTMPTANIWTRIKIQGIPAMPTSIGTWGTNFGEGVTGLYVGVVMGMGSQYQTANTNKWNAGFFGAGTTQSNMLSVTNNTMKITAMRLEASPQCSYATVNSFEADYHDCIRYYWSSFNYQSLTAGVAIMGMAINTNNAFFAYTFPRRMAKVPTVVPYSTSGTAGNITNISTSTNVAAATLSATQKGFNPSISATSTKADVFAAFIIADARLS